MADGAREAAAKISDADIEEQIRALTIEDYSELDGDVALAAFRELRELRAAISAYEGAAGADAVRRQALLDAKVAVTEGGFYRDEGGEKAAERIQELIDAAPSVGEKK